MENINIRRKLHKRAENYAYKELFSDPQSLLQKEKLLEASKKIRKRMVEKRISLKQLANKSKRIRKEIFDEFFS